MACRDYTCTECGGTFHSAWSEADALMEYQSLFSEAERAADPDPPALVCDDCYRRLMPKIEKLRRSTHPPGS